MTMKVAYFGWLSIGRLALIQACIGAVVVLTTSTLNRIMVIEIGLAASVPGLLVAWHYLVQFIRPRMGFASDSGQRLTPWVFGGMVVLALGGFLAAVATVQLATDRSTGLALAIVAFSLIGVGVSSSGTSVLVLLAKHVDDQRKAPAATLVWITMIAGFVLTAAISGKLLDPYSGALLLKISGGVSVIAIAVVALALLRLEPNLETNQVPEGRKIQRTEPSTSKTVKTATFKTAFWQHFKLVWHEPTVKRFTVFIFFSMLAYNAQDLILEPFAGYVFGFTPGQSTQLSGVQHGGVLLGMLIVAFCCGSFGYRILGERGSNLTAWMIGGCLASGLFMLGLSYAGYLAHQNASFALAWPIRANVFLLGVANGAFSIAAISSMMKMAGEQPQRAGTRMGVWGAAQAMAFGIGSLLGAVLSDAGRHVLGSVSLGYAGVFFIEALVFISAAWVAWTMRDVSRAKSNLELHLQS
jgi:MFS transporter, BCD family, chlorophyll transporter